MQKLQLKHYMGFVQSNMEKMQIFTSENINCVHDVCRRVLRNRARPTLRTTRSYWGAVRRTTCPRPFSTCRNLSSSVPPGSPPPSRKACCRYVEDHAPIKLSSTQNLHYQTQYICSDISEVFRLSKESFAMTCLHVLW